MLAHSINFGTITVFHLVGRRCLWTRVVSLGGALGEFVFLFEDIDHAKLHGLLLTRSAAIQATLRQRHDIEVRDFLVLIRVNHGALHALLSLLFESENAIVHVVLFRVFLATRPLLHGPKALQLLVQKKTTEIGTRLHRIGR